MEGKADELLTLGGCARLLRITPDTVRRLVRERRIPALRVGKQYRFDRDAVLAALPREGAGRAWRQGGADQ